MAEKLVPPGHRVESINVRPVDNGVTVRHHTQKDRPGKNESYDSIHQDHERVFENHQAATRHIGSILRAASGRAEKGRKFSRGGGR